MRMTAAVAALLVLFAAHATSQETPAENPHVAELMKAIAGKEQQPAGKVFKNVKMMKDVPAGQFLRIMDFGYSRSLDVDCDHCHVAGRWDADERRPKRAAREMMKMVGDINEQLSDMSNLDSAKPIVNCTTCHRGAIKPALQMR